ncbi:hypothetical protein [Pseudochelatococcus contaminans]|uniref:Uncharacterized protein n=1 Tax=Pseudochelatococcus contaminans TaxID=1538103 RepID=A0A7W5Z4J6_9HYPH|nr:hypothetical protein [Pseudochelatococcus contaminans]MBB3810068.1 hypothetical protein [Pseudochelatococcus contaminans]
MPENEVKLTEAEIRKIVAETVTETLLRLGVDVGKPLEVQADFQHLRQWRSSVETIKRQGVLTAIGIITVGVLGLIWQAVREGGSGP